MNNLLIFKTDLKTKKRAKLLKTLFNNNPSISTWSVDTEDVDNVLRIDANEEIVEKDIIRLLRTCGVYCEVLPE